MRVTGVYAVLSADGSVVVRVDDYGATGADVDTSRVKPLTENQPALSAGQVYGTPTFTIGASSVTRDWPVVTLDYNAIDQGSLNAALAEPGSVVRALALLTLQEINNLRTKAGLATYTNQQFVTALQAKMR